MYLDFFVTFKNLLTEKINITYDDMFQEILSDTILDKQTKELLIEYCNQNDVHTGLNLTFKDTLLIIWNIIQQ